MRTLELNKVDLWLVESLGKVEKTDDDGYLTGEYEFGYSVPKKVRLPLYPASGDILERTFGIDASLDMVSVTNDIELSEKSLLFYNEPTNNFDTTYDFKVAKILKSLNSFNYGLKGRI